VPTSDANKQIVGRYLRQNGNQSSVPDMLFPANHGENLMYTTLEKTILLRGVVLFQDIPADEIFHVAQITEEKRIPAGDVLFHEGDPGDSLYIVVEGSVRVHIGSQELAVFKKGDALGEMAVFDNLPRSATATALEDTTLLRISREQFFEVMTTRMEIMQSIVRTLSLRVRAANEQVTELMARS
jgi:CRP/FNR family cyclic AMP-dependent transcriptional regulator